MRYYDPSQNQLANYGPPPPIQQNPQYGNYMPMQQNNGYPQPNKNQMYGYQGTESIKNKLEGIEGVVIKQKFHLMEALVNVEQSNNYAVYRKKPDSKKKLKGKIFKYKEKSNFCARQCLSGSCKPYDMKVYNISKDDDDECMKCHKECTCSYYCFNREVMTCFLTEKGLNNIIGSVRDPFDCCDYTFEVYDERDNLDYILQADCCQAYFWCRCPCDACQGVHFD